jgi:hypothetical protein
MSIYLQNKLEELSEQIRTYPGPIAGCDQHLPALLEERARIIAVLQHEPCSPENLWAHDGGRINDRERE